MVSFMPCLTSVKFGLARWAAVVALFAALACPWALASDPAPTLVVKQQGDAVYLDANAHVSVPSEMKAVMLKGVPMVAVQILAVTQSRWYWSDAVLLDTRREWTISYQALTGQWTVVDLQTNQVSVYPRLDQAWSQITEVRAWRVADVAQLGALHDAQVRMRWYIDRRAPSKLAPITSAGAPDWHVDVSGQTNLSQLLAPVRDALPGARSQ